MANSVLNRLPMKIGAALALLLAAPAFAQEPAPAKQADSKDSSERREGSEYIVVTGGSVREPASATQSAEDMSLPELPTAPDESAAKK